MARGYELDGTIYLINDVQTFDSGFTKREFVVEAQDGQYSQLIKFECIKDKTALTDGLSKGDPVKVFFDIRGNEYKDRFYVNLNAWKIEKAGAGSGGPSEGGEAGPPSHLSEPPPGTDTSGGGEAAEDDIPF